MNKTFPLQAPLTDGIALVRVFVNTGRGGNPVPLVVDAQGMSSQVMRHIARQYGFESAFVFPPSSPDADWRFRFFVPEHEMEMCGHATVGTLWALRQWGVWRKNTAMVETMSGNVAAQWDPQASSVWISQPKARFTELSAEGLRLIAEVLGISRNTPGLHAINASTSRVKTLVRMPCVASLNALRPDFSRMRELCEAIGSTGLYPYALPGAHATEGFSVHARQFPKASGYPEDAATGIAASALWGWLRHTRELADAAGSCTVVQGEAMGSPSAIRIRARVAENGLAEGCWLSGEVAWAGQSCPVTQRLRDAGFELPVAPRPRARYASFSERAVTDDSAIISVSGQTSRQEDEPMSGCCRDAEDIDPARHAASMAALNALAILRDACGGELAHVRQILRLRGYIRSTGDFHDHSAVLDGASEIFAHAFPGQPLPARTAVGVAGLPSGCWVEIEIEAHIWRPLG